MFTRTAKRVAKIAVTAAAEVHAGGAQQKVVATTPYTGALTRLRLTKEAVYWVQRSATADQGDELWRSGR